MRGLIVAVLLAAPIEAQAQTAAPATCVPTVLETLSGTSVVAPMIVDSTGAVWEINGSQVVRNGVTDKVTRNVVKISYVQHVVYHENASKMWYAWKNNGWVYQSSPPPGITN